MASMPVDADVISRRASKIEGVAKGPSGREKGRGFRLRAPMHLKPREKEIYKKPGGRKGSQRTALDRLAGRAVQESEKGAKEK